MLANQRKYYKISTTDDDEWMRQGVVTRIKPLGENKQGDITYHPYRSGPHGRVTNSCFAVTMVRSGRSS